MEAYQLERSGGGMMESVMATAWGGGALSTEPISSHAHSARTSSGERAFEEALMMVEEVADQQSGGKSTAEERTAGREAETERSFAIYRPGQLARQREEEEDHKRAKAQHNASTAVEEASVCRRSSKWEPAIDHRRSATEADIREQTLRLPKGSETRRCLEQQAEVANKGIFALQPTGAEAKEQPETARLDTITCKLHANNTLLQCETISDGGNSHTRMNVSAMEPSAAEAVVKGAGGWVDVDMVVVLANGKRSCERQRRLRDGVVFTLRDPVTSSIMAAHHAPRVYDNGGEAPGLLLGGPTITALGLRPDPATRICTFRAPNRPAGRVPLLSQRRGSGGSTSTNLCANRNALGLRDRRSRLLFHVTAFIEKLEEKQPTGVGWLLENNVDTSGDERLYIKEYEKYITKIIGRALVIDEAGSRANDHRVRQFWTKTGDVERLKLAWERRADMQPRLLEGCCHRTYGRMSICRHHPTEFASTNRGSHARCHLILARPDSDAYSGEGAGMLFNISTGERERPTVHLKEELFGYEPNVIHGISLPDRERLIGNAMGLHNVAWIVGQLFVEQQRLRGAGRRAFGANAVSDGGGNAERSSAAAWANRGYTQASMNGHVEDVRSLKDPEKHWRCGRKCEASQQR
eukprot:jgi/Tetstr1/441079/TSEL_029347.t1